MRSLVLALLLLSEVARAFEAEGEVAAGRDFAVFTTDLRQGLLDDRLTLGAGYALVAGAAARAASPTVRHGARAAIDVDLDPFTVGALAGWAPAQEGRGWIAATLHGGHRAHRGRISVESTGGITLRRVDAALRGVPFPVDQLQLALESLVVLDERLHLGASALLSFYDPDLALRSLRGADVGLAVSVAGRPERWAVAARGGWRPLPSLRLEGGVGGAGYADGRGGAWLPRIAIRGGPVRGISVELAGELVVGAGAARYDPLRAVGTLGIEYAR